MRDCTLDYFVSIVIPAKNEEKNISLCINAIKKIDYPSNKYEIIVIDNGSTDSTKKIASKLGARVFADETGTIAALRNKGVYESKGDIIAFVDADVIVASSWLKHALIHFQNKNVVCVGSSPGIRVNPTWVEKIRYLAIESQPEVWIAKWLCSMNMVIRKKVFEEINGFDERLITCEDVDLCYRIGMKNNNYIIIRDKKIKAIHIGEAKTLLELFRKERWRATSNYSGLMYHGIIAHEIPSLIFPIINGSFFISSIFSLFFYNTTSFFIFISLTTLFPFSKAIFISLRLKRIKYIILIFLVQYIIMFSKVISFYDYILKIIIRQFATNLK